MRKFIMWDFVMREFVMWNAPGKKIVNLAKSLVLLTAFFCMSSCNNHDIGEDFDRKLLVNVITLGKEAAVDGVERKGLPDYVSYNQIPQDYPKELAEKDGCVVMESRSAPGWFEDDVRDILSRSYPVSGQEYWDGFLELVGQGETAKVRIVWYFVRRPYEGGELQEGEHRIFDLSYEDGEYLLYYETYGEAKTEEYAGLKCFEGDYYKQEWFLLGKHCLEMSYEDILSTNIFSADFGAKIPKEAYEEGGLWQVVYLRGGE